MNRALGIRMLATIALLVGAVGGALAQQVADYDAALAPHRAESRQFCEAAPECASMRPVLDVNGNIVKRG